MTRWLNLIGWLMCVIYATIPSFWLLIHPRADYWRSQRRSPYRILLPVWIGMWIALGFASAQWRHLSFYIAPWMWAPTMVLFLGGLRLYSLSGRHFSFAQLGGLPEVLSQHVDRRLVTVGIHSRVRHPVYLAHLCEMLAWSVGTGLAVCYALTVFAMLTGAAMIRLEDRELEQRFGEEYRNYRRHIPSMLPRFFKRKLAHQLPVSMIIREMLANMPPGIATAKAFGEGIGEYVLVAPSNSSAAYLSAFGAGAPYQVDIGAGTSFDQLDAEDVREICKAVFSGHFEEEIWMVADGDITRTTGSLSTASGSISMTHLNMSFHPFARKEKKVVKYAPYDPFFGDRA
jgi:protein-S-isoprenylcysteine O-methyltransferase Ste14